MKQAKPTTLIALLIICASSSIALAQADTSSLVVLKCSWEKERLQPMPSLASLASQEELIQQSQREQQLSAAKNAGDRGKVTKLETQIKNQQQAKAEVSQTELPRHAYRYKVMLRNDSEKKIKSIDWDYLFIEPTTQEVLSRHEFTSDESIKPGKSKEISVLYPVPPVKMVNVKTLNKRDPLRYTEQVVVARITYSDGSVWQHP